MKAYFDSFDIDGSATISVSELQTVFKSMGIIYTKAKILEMMAAVDTDGNEEIDFFEFCAMMKKG